MQSGAPAALVMEDDALATESLPAVLAQAVAQHAAWDLLKLHWLHRGAPLTVRNIGPASLLVRFLGRQTGTAAYMINRRSAGALLSGLFPQTVPYDYEIDQGWKYGFRIRGMLPQPVVLAEHGSTIGRPPHRRSFTRAAYRLTIELQRAWNLVAERHPR